MMILVTRDIPRSLAPVVERLELESPQLVSTSYIRRLGEELDVATPGHVVVQRLAERGWLLPTGVRGAWEFAPARRAGPYSTGGHSLLLRAQLLITPDLPAAVALESALWAHGLADRAPNQLEIAVPPREHVPAALDRGARVTRFALQLPTVEVDNVPIHAVASVLVHLADSPTDVRSWAAVQELLPPLVDRVSVDDVTREADTRPHATLVRLAYLLDGLDHPTAQSILAALSVEPRGKVWFGPRRTLKRHNARWNVADTILPTAPARRGPSTSQ